MHACAEMLLNGVPVDKIENHSVEWAMVLDFIKDTRTLKPLYWHAVGKYGGQAVVPGKLVTIDGATGEEVYPPRDTLRGPEDPMWREDKLRALVPHRTEWRLFSEEY